MIPIVQGGVNKRVDALNIGKAITATGVLNAGSITSGFGAIDIGTDPLTAGAVTATTVTASDALTVTRLEPSLTLVSTHASGKTWLVSSGGDGQFAPGTYGIRNATDGRNPLKITSTAVTDTLVLSSTGLAVTGVVAPEADNTRTLGTAALRWSVVYAGNGTINTSDAREKTAVRGMTAPEIAAAKALSKEIGIYKFLASVEAKGDKAREHVGFTVQRAIEIMESHGLSPFNYGFVCFDKWEDTFVEHAEIVAVEAVAGIPATYESVVEIGSVVIDGKAVDTQRNILREIAPAIPASEAVEAKAAWTETTQKAGDRYGFRYDQLNLFIARGFEARLAALETP